MTFILPGALSTLLFAGAAWGQTTFAVPAGQDETIRAMLTPDAGQVWPCSLARAQFGPERIVAEYTCEGRPLRVWLDHPSTASADDELRRTERFVIRFQEAPPPELPALLEDSVRAAEVDFRWVGLDAPPPGRPLRREIRAPAFSSPLLTSLRSPSRFAVDVLALALVFFLADRLIARRKRRQS